MGKSYPLDICFALCKVAPTTEVNKIDFQETLKSTDTLLDLQENKVKVKVKVI